MDADAHAARLREVLLLTAQHVPQADIAARYGVTTRTVRNWTREARERRLGTFRRATADEFLADSEWSHSTLKAVAWRRLVAAEAVGDDIAMLRWARQLQSLDVTRSTIRLRCGFFGARPLFAETTTAREEEDREARSFARVQAGMRLILAAHDQGLDTRAVSMDILEASLAHPDDDPGDREAEPLF